MVKIVKNPGIWRLNNLNDPNRPQCVKDSLSTRMQVLCNAHSVPSSRWLSLSSPTMYKTFKAILVFMDAWSHHLFLGRLEFLLPVGLYSSFKSKIHNHENNQQDALYRLIYYSKSALHVSGDVFAHHQEHLTVFIVSGSVHPSCCRLVPAAT